MGAPPRLIARLAVAGALAGCGHAARPAPPPAAAATPAPLVYVWRNVESTGVPDELTVSRDGALRYRNLLHTQTTVPTLTGRLRAAELAALRRLVRRADLRAADASSLRPDPGGFRYVIRAGGQVGTAVDGHLHGGVGRLVLRVRALMDRLERRSL